MCSFFSTNEGFDPISSSPHILYLLINTVCIFFWYLIQGLGQKRFMLSGTVVLSARCIYLLVIYINAVDRITNIPWKTKRE